MIEVMLKESREMLDIKEIDVANSLNVSNKTVSGWENGYDTIPMKRLIEYANTYSLSLDYLFGITKKNTIYKPIKIDLKVIGNNLKELRIQNNKTQYDIASAVSIATGAYSNYENGKYLVSVKCLDGLIKIYPDISIDKLFNRKK